MFVDFNKVFGKTPQTELKIPQALIDQLSSKLPDGFIYVVDSNNNLTISHDGKKDLKYTISGMILEPTDQQKEILGDDFSFDDIMNLSYNSQKPVPVRFKNGKYVNINGTDISIEQLSYNPFKPYELVIDSTYIHPSPFPPPFTIQIGNINKKIELSIKRIPHNSLDTNAFKSDDSKCLSVVYYLNPDKRYLSMTINIMISKAKSVQEIIDSIEIYNAFIEGKGYIFNALIDSRLETTNANKYDDEALAFWKKVKKLEDKLGVSFDPHVSEFEFKDICNIEEIYQNIINKAPIRHNTSINSITSKIEFSKDNTAKDALEKPIYFEFNGKSVVALLGQEIELPCIIGVFNAVFTKYEKNEERDECTIFLENESDEKQMYISELRFLNDEELLKYKEETPDRMNQFKNAKKIHEYLTR